MYLFVLIAAAIAVALVAGGFQRPRAAIFVAAILWAIYAVYEYYVANGTLCDANCNIRVDLVVIFPILIAATLYARSSYSRPPGQQTVIGLFLCAGFLLIAALVIEAFGYTIVAVATALCAVALVLFAFKKRAAMPPSLPRTDG